MFLAIVILSLSIQWGQCDKVSPKPGLKIFREDYKSVEETCFAVGFVRNEHWYLHYLVFNDMYEIYFVQIGTTFQVIEFCC